MPSSPRLALLAAALLLTTSCTSSEPPSEEVTDVVTTDLPQSDTPESDTPESDAPESDAQESDAQEADTSLPGSAAKPNVLLVILDDIGVDAIARYRALEAWDTDFPSGVAASTPNFDALVDNGVLFRTVWASPTCTPTRMGIHTGRLGHRTGVFDAIGPKQEALTAAEVTLPEVLGASYDKGLFGKWHLGRVVEDAPISVGGWNVYSGAPDAAVTDYFNWDVVTLTDMGTVDERTSTDYATTVNVDEALEWVDGLTGDKPWLLTVAFNAPHTPFHLPPAELRPSLTDATLDSDNDGECDDDALCGMAMLEAADTELGRLVAGLAPLAGTRDTVVIVIGDNGSARQLIQPPFRQSGAKGTLYEGGVRVPMVVSGPASIVAARGSADVLVHTSDLFATIIDLAGAELPTLDLDSVSFRNVLGDLDSQPRTVLYTDGASGGQQNKANGAALRNRTHKLVVSDLDVATYECFDLTADPAEESDLSAPSNPECETLWDAFNATR